MYGGELAKYGDRPADIVSTMLHSDMSETKQRQDADEEAYHRFEHYSSPYPEIWRESPPKSSSINDAMVRHHDVTPRSPVIGEYGYNGNMPLSSVDMEPFSGLFSFSTGYKELPTFKEKAANDSQVADALLSLKHGVVHHSQLGTPLSPLSPGLPTAPHSAGSAVGQVAPFACNLNQQSAVHGTGACFGAGAGETGCASSQFGEQPMAGGQYAQHGMFPSMSVNVSMSMNVGVPTANVQNCNVPEHAQWAGHYGAQGLAPSPGPAYYGPGSMAGQTQYPPSYGGAAVGPQSFHATYTFSDLRGTKDAIYRNAASDPYKAGVAKFYSLNPLSMRRSKSASARGAAGGADGAKLNLCRICGKTYARPSTLKTHMRTHSGEKPYRCTTCNKSFSQAANLTAHVRTHSGEKPFRCPVCERRFSQSSSVTTHMRTHSGERPYRCRMCKKAFSDSSTLTKHLRIHSGEKPYQCKLCLLRFSQSGNLNRHMRVHANNS